MSDTILQEIDRDLQRAPNNRVVYLEGKSDIEIFFALLGHSRPVGDAQDGVLIRGLIDGPSGASGARAVKLRVEIAQRHGRSHVYGFIDGDGRDLSALDPLFRGPGPLFSWRSYAIENLLVRAGWPPAFGPTPDWPVVMRTYSALVAINRLGVSLRDALSAHQLHRFIQPGGDVRMRDRTFVRAQMLQARSVLDRDLAGEFDQIADHFEQMTHTDVEAAHTWLNGKWLVEHHVQNELNIRPCRERWVQHIRGSGLPEVIDRWRSIH